MQRAAHTIGLMSGTSADGVDGVLAQWPPQGQPIILAHAYEPFGQALRQELLSLNRPGHDELARAAQAGSAVAQVYARVTQTLLARSGCEARQVQALGAHGQTVRHKPKPDSGATGLVGEQKTEGVLPSGYTIQLLNGALLAELTGIDVVCDFRSRDVAAGGQGAPLVPALHDALFARSDEDVAVLNIGGISNLSLLPATATSGAARTVIGFDCGPGNALMDAWCEACTGARFDKNGDWGAGGTVDNRLLSQMLAEPYFALPPPKSTGRDLFDKPWLDPQLQRIAATGRSPSPQDVQATLTELTAVTAADALLRHSPRCSALLVCGGGALNAHLMRRLGHHLQRQTQSRPQGKLEVGTTAQVGVPVDQVEALAFAWLAQAHLKRLPGNLPAVSGAAGPRVLGALYPAS